MLILRPQPGATRTAEQARAIRLEPVVAPLFMVRPVDWSPPKAKFEAVMLTSANAGLHGGEALAAYRELPAYAVGEASAAAAHAAGFRDVRTGRADAAALLELIAGDGVREVLHLAGRDRIGLSHPDLRILAVTVYAAEAVESLPPEAEAAIRRDALVLLHSPRAAALFAGLIGARREAIRIAAISPATATAAGEGWAAIAIAARPRDEALLELAAKLCQNDRE